MKHAYLLLVILVLLLGCSSNKSKQNVVDKAANYNHLRIEYKGKADSTNYSEYVTKSKDMLKEVEALPTVSGWAAGDSLKLYLTKALEGDIKYYESLKKGKGGSMDDMYNDLTAKSQNLGYDIKIMEILIDEKKQTEEKK